MNVRVAGGTSIGSLGLGNSVAMERFSGTYESFTKMKIRQLQRVENSVK